MKPFDLQAAIAGAPIQFNDGQKLKFVAYVPEAKYNDHFVFLDASGHICSTSVTTVHIFMSPVSKTYWVNVYASKTGSLFFCTPYDNEAAATQYLNCVDGYIKTISFEVDQ
jgi:hypothetical protein